MNRVKEKLNIIIPLLIILVIMVLWTNYKEFDRWGDEVLRYQIPKFFFDYNRLPTLFDKKIYDSVYGFSYAAQPNLPYIIMAIVMKIAYFIGVSQPNLLWVARGVNIIAGVVFAYLVMKIADELWKDKYIKYIFFIITACWPGLLYLFIYVNTDAMALVGVAIVTLFLIKGTKYTWSIKNCIGLAVGDILILLSYQNAYAYVVVSAIVFVASFFGEGFKKIKWKELLAKGFSILAGVGVATSWFYIRNYLLYGTLMGGNISGKLSMLYGQEGMSTAIRAAKAYEKMSSFGGIKEWANQSLTTFFAWGWYDAIKFNYPHIIYQIVKVIIVIFGIIALVRLIKKWKKIIGWKKVIIIGMIIGAIINASLSFLYCLFSDYVPIGRYWMPSIITFGMIMVYGIKEINEIIRVSNRTVMYIIAILFAMIDISVVVFR